MMNKLEEMFRLQQRLNDETNGKNWERGVTNKGKEIDWKRCIYMESCELIDSYPWKHWKDISAECDRENIVLEVVDIWHFVMSELLRLNKLNNNRDITSLANDISQRESYIMFCSGIKSDHCNDNSKEIELIESFLQSLFCNKDFMPTLDKFFEMARHLDMTLTSLYNLYIGKNILNQFRQDNGYKEGKYKKIWNDREDNTIMQEILNNSPSPLTADELYKELKRVYETIL